MELTYRSVTQFYLDLKAHLLASGLTAARTLAPETDVILDTGSGFLRLQKKVVSPAVVAVGWEFGTDADVLAVSAFDCERVLPFAIQPDAEFTPTFNWYGPTRSMSFMVVASGPDAGRRYYVECCIDEKKTMVLHRDRANFQYEPNFKDTGGTYLSAGA